jgi:hypothetical protein
VIDRASTFADPKIVSLLQSRFVTVAIDQFYQRRQKDSEGNFYRKIAAQGPRKNELTTQGLYVAMADGTLLAFMNHRDPERIRRVLEQSLENFRPNVTPPIGGSVDPLFERKPPEGGLVVRVHAKVLGGYEQPRDREQKILQSARARDNLWIRKDEHNALVRNELPATLQRRMARFHLVDNTRGEPPIWDVKAIRRLDLKLESGKLSGAVCLETKSGRRGYHTYLFGCIETDGERIVRFNVVARGEYWGEGPFTQGAPKGKFPLRIAFTLATGDDEADRVPPQGAKPWLRRYIS